jgi:hypothetical protein
MSDPWAFGWNQLLPIVGFALTAIIAGISLRTFNRWKREKIEEKKIEFAFDALAIAYETKYIFGNIRAPMMFEAEYKDMPRRPGESDDRWHLRGNYYGVHKRIEAHKDFFDRVWQLQPRFMAAYGPQTEEIFELLHQCRRDIQVSAIMLSQEDTTYRDPTPKVQELLNQARRDLWSTGNFEPEKDVVSRRLEDFRERMEKLCRPIIDREYVRNQKAENLLAVAEEAIKLVEESRKKRKVSQSK